MRRRHGDQQPIKLFESPVMDSSCWISPACLPSCDDSLETPERQVGGGDRGAVDDVIAVLRDPPKKVPRSPTWVRATLAERSCLEPEDSVPSVQVRWRVPSQASLLPTVCGDVQRYYIKCWCHGKGREVIATKTSTVDVPRRDFCRNQVS